MKELIWINLIPSLFYRSSKKINLISIYRSSKKINLIPIKKNTQISYKILPTR